MADVSLDKVFEEAKRLPKDEQRKLRSLLDRLLVDSLPKVTEEEFEQKLFELGLFSEVKPPITDFKPYRDRKPIEVKGKPLSEVIIEERR